MPNPIHIPPVSQRLESRDSRKVWSSASRRTSQLSWDYSVTRWLYCFSILGHLHQWKFAQWLWKFAKVGSKECQTLKNSKKLHKIAKVAKFCQIWSHWLGMILRKVWADSKLGDVVMMMINQAERNSINRVKIPERRTELNSLKAQRLKWVLTQFSFFDSTANRPILIHRDYANSWEL